MTLLEFNSKVMSQNKTLSKVPEITEEMLIKFQEVVHISNIIKSRFDSTDDANSFFAVFPSIKNACGTGVCTELFYACKLGFWMPGVPSKLVYIITKAFKECGKDFVNKAILSCLSLLRVYADCSFESDGEVLTVKDVIENLIGRPVTLLTDSVRKVDSGNGWEVFIPNVNRVAVIPSAIADMISYYDCDRLEFKKDLGIVLGDIPIRTFNNYIGIVKDDFDLRECF